MTVAGVDPVSMSRPDCCRDGVLTARLSRLSAVPEPTGLDKLDRRSVSLDDPVSRDDSVSPGDLELLRRQLQRPARGVAGIAWRCPCGKPGVVATEPRLPDGSPFPTTYYLTCPQATAGCSTLESRGVMAEMTARLAVDAELATAYRRAHESYLRDRDKLGTVPEIAGVSAGGMPDRVKCLHVLVGHALAAGPGVNPLGDEALTALGKFWQHPCLTDSCPVDPCPVDPCPVDPGPDELAADRT